MTAPYTPKFLQPDPDGSLSNTATPTFKVRYASSRGTADPAGQVQFVGTRVGQAGVLSQTPQNVLLSGWLGAPTINSLPVALHDSGVAYIATGPGQGQYGDVEGRVYVCGGQDAAGAVHSEVWSAPYSGGSVGTWRVERPMTVYNQIGLVSPNLAPRYAHACCIATFGQAGGSGQGGLGHGGVPWLLVYGGYDGVNSTNPNSNLLGAVILPDGTLSPWVTLALAGWTPIAYGKLVPLPDQYLTSCLMLSGGLTGTPTSTAITSNWVTAVRGAPASSATIGDWDTPGGWWQNMPSFANATCGHNVVFDWPNGKLIAVRGTDNATTNQTGMYYLSFGLNISNWTFNWASSWTPMAAGTAATNAACLYFMAPYGGEAGGSPDGYMYVIGGNNAAAAPGCVSNRASAINTIQIAVLGYDTSRNPTGVSWVNSSNPLPVATTGMTAIVGSHLALDNLRPEPWVDGDHTRLSVFGGMNAGSAALATVRSATLPVPPFSGNSNSAWTSSPATGAGLASADLGTGGVVAASTAPDAPAGAQDVSFVYGNIPFTTTQLPLVAGDLVQMSVQFTDKVGGDPSVMKGSIIKIGNAPTITNLAVSSTATGQPVVSLAFNAGTGGAGEASWRITVTRHSDLVGVFDTGVRIDQQNQAQVVCAPMLTNVQYDIQATVTSLDVAVPSSTDTATSSITHTPALAAAPAAPTSVSAVGDSVGKWMQLNYTTQTGTTAVRIYHRVNGTTPWTLLVDNLASTVGAQSVKLMDRLEIGTAYDFYVSALGTSQNMESVASATVSGISIPADAASPSAYLHIAGQPLGTALGVPVQMQSWPTMQVIYASKVIPRFNAAHPVGRQGVLNYRVLEIEFMSVHGANLGALEAVIDALLGGAVCFYRDRRGTCFPCILNTPEDVQFIYPDHTALKVRLVQVDDLYSPSTANGSALGIPTLVNGSLPPLRRAAFVA